MRKLWVWGLGMTVLVGLSAATGRVRADDEDNSASVPKIRYARGPGLMDRLFQASEKPAPKKPAKKDADKADKTEKDKDKAGKPAVENAVVVRAREEAAWMRRVQVCDRLKNLANQTNDEELYRRAEELEQRAWTLFRQRTAHLPVSHAVSETDEEVLDRHLGNKTASAAKPDAILPGAAKAKDRNSQAAVREVKP